MPIHIDFETDTLYLKGFEQGVQKERRASVLNLWRKDIEPPMISKLLNLPFEYVQRVVTECQKTQNNVVFSSN